MTAAVTGCSKDVVAIAKVGFVVQSIVIVLIVGWVSVKPSNEDFKVLDVEEPVRESKRVAREVLGWAHLNPIFDDYLIETIKIREERIAKHDVVEAQACELLIVLPTMHRIKTSASDESERLDEVLNSFRTQTKASDGYYDGFPVICILVLNGSPGLHIDYDRVREYYHDSRMRAMEKVLPAQCFDCHGRCREWCSTSNYCGTTDVHKAGVDCHADVYFKGDTQFQFIEQYSFIDPTVGDRLPHTADVEEDRRQTLAHALEHASLWRSKYVMMMEDDVGACDSSVMAKVYDAIKHIEETCRKSTLKNIDWSMISMGNGISGTILHWADVRLLADYLLSTDTAKSSIVSDLKEWSLLNSKRIPFSHRYNLFSKISSGLGCSKIRALKVGSEECNNDVIEPCVKTLNKRT